MKRYCSIVLVFAVSYLAACSYGGDGGTQGEVTVIVENNLTQTLYVNWMSGGRGLASCEHDQGGDWEMCRFYSPSCTDECTPDNQGQACILDCGIGMPMVREIQSGASFEITWDGSLYSVDDTHCSEGDCYKSGDPAPGKYKAQVCAYDGYTCEWEPCAPPDAQGIVQGASPSGTPTCSSTEFHVVYQENALTITIGN
jgi:hypothetical protein